MREYRARKKVRIQSTIDSSSVVHHQDDGILQADDNLNKSHAFVGLPCQDINATCKRTPAKRMREYRARKKVRIQSTIDSSSVVHHQDDGILQADDNLNKSHAFVGLPCQDINATCKRTPAKRMREYRARKKVRIQSTIDSSSVVHHQDDGILQADDNLNKSHAFVGLPCQDINATCKRTPAKRMREYRARKKVRIQSTIDSSSVVHHQDDGILQADDNLNKSHAFVGLPCQDINATCKRTPAKRMREYRARKKVRIQSTIDSSSVVHHQDDGILQADDNLNKSHAFVGLPCQDINATCKRTPAKRMREYRARKKVRIQSTIDSSSVVHHQDDGILQADDN
ncbi:hypothetical protein TNCT_144171 [Trichonephila clavata]|uniref:Uncharacterized protein n=1 Tax=Trichonephila clavata TaxID=2740835 RepID=A0A8X6L2B2_TRICU|nr:hypothetical protein TNCT_144171 [Trichonephila clavata]